MNNSYGFDNISKVGLGRPMYFIYNTITLNCFNDNSQTRKRVIPTEATVNIENGLKRRKVSTFETSINSLPEELLIKIFETIQAKEFIKLRCVSRLFLHAIYASNRLCLSFNDSHLLSLPPDQKTHTFFSSYLDVNTGQGMSSPEHLPVRLFINREPFVADFFTFIKNSTNESILSYLESIFSTLWSISHNVAIINGLNEAAEKLPRLSSLYFTSIVDLNIDITELKSENSLEPLDYAYIEREDYIHFVFSGIPESLDSFVMRDSCYDSFIIDKFPKSLARLELGGDYSKFMSTESSDKLISLPLEAIESEDNTKMRHKIAAKPIFFSFDKNLYRELNVKFDSYKT